MPPANAAPAPQPEAPPARVVKARDPKGDVGLLVAELVGWADKLKRAHVAFHTLNGAYQTVMGQTPAGERKKGMPIIEFTGVLEGKEKSEPVKCVTDLKKVPKQYLPHVLVPLLSVAAGEVLESLNEVEARANLLRPILTAIASQSQPQPAETEDEEDEEDDDGE